MKKYIFVENTLTFEDTIKEQFYIPREIARAYFGKKCKVKIKIEGE